MDNLLHKLCEKSEAELWEMVKVEQWTPEHAKITYYLTEIMKGVKKMEHLKLVQEAMKKAEEMGEEGMEHMMGKEKEMSHYARRGGRRGGRYNYTYDNDEGENYVRGGSSGGRGGSSSGGNYANYGYEEPMMDCPPYMTDPRRMMPPMMYEGYMDHKIREKVEKEWEKEEKRREKEEERRDKEEQRRKEREREQRENMMPPGRTPPPPPGK